MIAKLQRVWEHRHTPSFLVAAAAAAAAWYAGDLGYTSMPPEWVITAIAFVAGGLTTAAVQEMRERGWVSSSASSGQRSPSS